MERGRVYASRSLPAVRRLLVYAAVFGATLASIRSVKTSVVAFDTEIADLTDKLSDPVDVLFGCQLGGGTPPGREAGHALIRRVT